MENGKLTCITWKHQSQAHIPPPLNVSLDNVIVGGIIHGIGLQSILQYANVSIIQIYKSKISN